MEYEEQVDSLGPFTEYLNNYVDALIEFLKE
jgi:hypothetical protein